MLTVLSLLHHLTTSCATLLPHVPPTLNFSDTSRGPTIKCYTFLETSHDPQLGSQLRCKNFANFYANLFCKPTFAKLPEVLPTSVIPFWKALMTLESDFNSNANILPFLQPYYAAYKQSREKENFSRRGPLLLKKGKDLKSNQVN